MLGFSSIFFHVLFYRARPWLFHQHCRARTRARIAGCQFFNQCMPSWLAGCTWHSLACIDSSPSMKKLPGNALVRTFRNTLCCWNNQQIQVSPRNQKQHFPLTACQATVTTNSLRTYSSVFTEWYYILRQDDLSLEPLDIQSIKCFSHRTRFGVLLVHVWSCQIIRWQIIVGHFTCRTPNVVKNAYADLAKDCQV